MNLSMILFYNFASDDVLQRQRVKFPLPYYNGDKKSNIEERNWKHDDLFTKQHYYTLLFDREEDMDLVGDTSLTSVQVEWMFVKTRMVKRYYFERIKGAWILEAINLRYPLNKVIMKTLLSFSDILQRIVFFRVSVCGSRWLCNQ